MEPQVKKKVLFLCVHNSARSQMAEALLNTFASDKFEVSSAGIDPTEMSREAVTVMQEVGANMAHNTSKPVSLFATVPFDLVVSLCDMTTEDCPTFPGKQALKWNLHDPERAPGAGEQKLAVFRTVRDDLSAKIMQELIPLLLQ